MNIDKQMKYIYSRLKVSKMSLEELCLRLNTTPEKFKSLKVLPLDTILKISDILGVCELDIIYGEKMPDKFKKTSTKELLDYINNSNSLYIKDLLYKYRYLIYIGIDILLLLILLAFNLFNPITIFIYLLYIIIFSIYKLSKSKTKVYIVSLSISLIILLYGYFTIDGSIRLSLFSDGFIKDSVTSSFTENNSYQNGNKHYYITNTPIHHETGVLGYYEVSKYLVIYFTRYYGF